MRGPVLWVVTAVLLAGCGGGDEPPDAQTAQDAETQTCSLVRAGIDAFNDGDFGLTVDVFVEALEPAREYADLSDEPIADDLLEAVEYYADVPADEYLEAFQTSPEFRRHQVVTLGLCEAGPAADGAVRT